MKNLSFTLDITSEGSSIFNDHISFNNMKVSYRLFKLPIVSINITIYDWRELRDWKELNVTAELYDQYSFEFPVTITGVKLKNRGADLIGIISKKDSLLTKKSRFLGYDFISAYNKLDLYQTYDGIENVEVPEDSSGDEDPGGSGFFQLNCTDTDMALMLIKGISKDYFTSFSWNKLKLVKFSQGEFKDMLSSSSYSPSLFKDNLRYATEIQSYNPETNFEFDSTEVQRDCYYRFKNKRHYNYELCGVSSFIYNKDFNDNINHNIKLEDGLEYSHVISYSKYYDVDLCDLIPYPTGTNISKLMVIGKEIILDKTSVVTSNIELGAMKDEIK